MCGAHADKAVLSQTPTELFSFGTTSPFRFLGIHVDVLCFVGVKANSIDGGVLAWSPAFMRGHERPHLRYYANVPPLFTLPVHYTHSAFLVTTVHTHGG